jgi:hypothetical protein
VIRFVYIAIQFKINFAVASSVARKIVSEVLGSSSVSGSEVYANKTLINSVLTTEASAFLAK